MKKATKRNRLHEVGKQMVQSGGLLAFMAVVCKVLGEILASFGVNVDMPAVNMLFFWFMPIAIVAVIAGALMMRHGKPEEAEGSGE